MVLATIYLYYVPWHMRKPLGWKIGINSVLVWWELHPELRLSSTSLPRNEPSCSRRWKIEVKAIYTKFPWSIARTFKWRWSIDRQNVNLQQVSWHRASLWEVWLTLLHVPISWLNGSNQVKVTCCTSTTLAAWKQSRRKLNVIRCDISYQIIYHCFVSCSGWPEASPKSCRRCLNLVCPGFLKNAGKQFETTKDSEPCPPFWKSDWGGSDSFGTSHMLQQQHAFNAEAGTCSNWASVASVQSRSAWKAFKVLCAELKT